jgi:hypothetical protein
MGEIAAKTLLARMKGETPTPIITVSPLLIVRESTGPVPGSPKGPSRSEGRTLSAR